MLFYSPKNIRHWAYWHHKKKLWFNSLNGFILAVVIMTFVFGAEFLIHSFLSPVRTTFLIVLLFASGFVFGMVAWTENEALYGEWLKKQSHRTKKQFSNPFTK